MAVNFWGFKAYLIFEIIDLGNALMNIQYPYTSQLAFLEVKVPVINLWAFFDFLLFFFFLFSVHVMNIKQDNVLRCLKATELWSWWKTFTFSYVTLRSYSCEVVYISFVDSPCHW